MNTHLNVVVLHSPDLSAARAFYTGTLGFVVAEEHSGNVLEFRGEGGAELALMETRSTRTPESFAADLWFVVPDVDSYHARVVAAGARDAQAPQDSPFGRMFTLVTPDGHRLTFHEVRP